MRFSPPPGWPAAPPGWQPPAGWSPDPSWPPAPPVWPLWVDPPTTGPTGFGAITSTLPAALRQQFSSPRNRAIGIAAFLAILVVVVACISVLTSHRKSPPVSSSSAGSTGAPTSPAMPTPTAPQKVTGLVILDFSTSGTCVVKTVDPQSGSLHAARSFNSECPTDSSSHAQTFGPSFDRMALYQTSPQRAGWLNEDGTITYVGPTPEAPNFGPSISAATIGFDKLDNFYYDVGHGSSDPNGGYTEYFKVPAGSTSDGQLIGTLQGGTNSHFGRLPGGTLGLGAQWELGDERCSMKSLDGDFDPDRHVYYYGDQGQIFKSDNWCDGSPSADLSNRSGNALTPDARDGVGSIAVSPDGSQIAFESLGQIYFTSATASAASTPKPLNVPELTNHYAYNWTLWKWA